eukprot:GHRR01007753.1.p1 GENE.GHRR01007753.1~~GHRR01007753.1.p1  ORF type:complete len:584 (+),score=189.94 GHRR01007753.1:471-2222(+)
MPLGLLSCLSAEVCPDCVLCRYATWPQKSSLFLFRTDGMSCSRELVTGTGRFQFAHPSTQQHLLVWRDRPKVVMVIKKLGRELTQEFMEVVSYLTGTENMHVVVEPRMYDVVVRTGLPVERVFTFTKPETDRLADCVDFVVCLGGDGVILHASSLFKRHIPPMVSFHLGSMGFLTNHPYPDYKKELHQIMYGYQSLATCALDSADLPAGSNGLGVMITLRMRLHCAIVRAGQSQPEQVYEVLNEIVVDRGSNSFLTNIEAYIDGRFITRVQADGIMLATPTGSTAYSVAAGGSMVHPNVQAILLTPICPHSLNFRPIILPDYIEMELRVPETARVSAWVCFDGKQRQELHHGDSVFIKMSENPVPTINRTDLTTDWFESLERCFRWSNRMEQKPFEDEWVLEEAQHGFSSSYPDKYSWEGTSIDSGDSSSAASSGCGSASVSSGLNSTTGSETSSASNSGSIVSSSSTVRSSSIPSSSSAFEQKTGQGNGSHDSPSIVNVIVDGNIGSQPANEEGWQPDSRQRSNGRIGSRSGNGHSSKASSGNDAGNYSLNQQHFATNHCDNEMQPHTPLQTTSRAHGGRRS